MFSLPLYIPLAEEQLCDLYVGHTDRRVAVYHWSNETSGLEMIKTFPVSGQVSAICRGA